MIKRKAFVSLELLLVVGVAIAGLGATFSINKKVNNTMDGIRFSQSLKGLMMAIDHQYNKFRAYPKQEYDGVAVGETDVYEPEDRLMVPGSATNWHYRTISSTNEDDKNFSTGSVLIRIPNGRYSEIGKQEVLANYFHVCENSMLDIDVFNAANGTASTIPKLSGKHEWCLIKRNVKIFTPN